MGINSYTYSTGTPSSDVISLTSKENLEVCLQHRNVIRRSLTTYRRSCDLQGIITNHYHPLENLTKAWIKWRNATELKEKIGPYMKKKNHKTKCLHDDVIKWNHFPRYWPFVREIDRSPVDSPHKGQWRRTLMFSLICIWTNNRYAGYLRRHHDHYDVTVMAGLLPV